MTDCRSHCCGGAVGAVAGPASYLLLNEAAAPVTIAAHTARTVGSFERRSLAVTGSFTVTQTGCDPCAGSACWFACVRLQVSTAGNYSLHLTLADHDAAMVSGAATRKLWVPQGFGGIALRHQIVGEGFSLTIQNPYAVPLDYRLTVSVEGE